MSDLDEETPCCTFCGDEDAPYRDHDFGVTVVNVCRDCAIAAGIAQPEPVGALPHTRRME